MMQQYFRVKLELYLSSAASAICAALFALYSSLPCVFISQLLLSSLFSYPDFLLLFCFPIVMPYDWYFYWNTSRNKTYPSLDLATEKHSTQQQSAEKQWQTRLLMANTCCMHSWHGQHCFCVQCSTRISVTRKGNKFPSYQKCHCNQTFEKGQIKELESKSEAKPLVTITPPQYTFLSTPTWNEMPLQVAICSTDILDTFITFSTGTTFLVPSGLL